MFVQIFPKHPCSVMLGSSKLNTWDFLTIGAPGITLRVSASEVSLQYQDRPLVRQELRMSVGASLVPVFQTV